MLDNPNPEFPNIQTMLQALHPTEPVYCVHPHIYKSVAQRFLKGFPGRVLYAVKANDDPSVIKALIDGGISHFDCASLVEIQTVRQISDQVTCYFMIPVYISGAATQAQQDFGVKHFVVDHMDGLTILSKQIDVSKAVIFARMAVHHPSAGSDLSKKFGAPPEDIPLLLHRIHETGAEPALAFNVGSTVKNPEAYVYGLSLAEGVIEKLAFQLRLVDIGGGYPINYPGFQVPPMADYFDAIRKRVNSIKLAKNGEIMAEPGRSLAAEGVSAVSQVLLRKGERLYINDGMYGIFWELRYHEHDRYPVRVYRNGELVESNTKEFTIYGPTCDSSDCLPGRIYLPENISAGDHLVFSHIGAYSMAGRTRFNGYFSDNVVIIHDE